MAGSELSKVQKTEILQSHGLQKAEIQAALATKSLGEAQVGTSTATSGLSMAMKGLWASIKPFLGIAAIFAGLAIIGKILDEAIKTQDELNDSFTNLSAEYKEAQSEISKLNSELETTNERIVELQRQDGLTFVEQEELKSLKEANKELKRELEIKEALANALNTEARSTAKDYFSSTSNYNTDYESYNESSIPNKILGLGIIRSTGSTFGNPVEELNAKAALYKKYQEDVEKTKQKIAQYEIDNPDYSNEHEWGQYNDLQKELKAYEAHASELKTDISSIYDSIKEKKTFLNPKEDAALISEIDLALDNLASTLGKAEDRAERFNNVWNSDEFKDIVIELEFLSKTGNISKETLGSVEKYTKFLEALGVTSDELYSHLYRLYMLQNGEGLDFNPYVSKRDALSDFNTSIAPGFDKIQQIISSIEAEDTKFDFGLLDEDFNTEFAGLGEAYDNFMENLEKFPKDIKANEDSINDLVSAWISQKDILNQVDEETATLIGRMLESKGVTNATEVATAALMRAKADAWYESQNFEEKTSEEIFALAEEEAKLYDNEYAFRLYVFQKNLADSLNLNNAETINQLAKEAESLGLASKAWSKYYQYKSRMAFLAENPDYKVATETEGEFLSAAEIYKSLELEGEKELKQLQVDINNLITDGINVEPTSTKTSGADKDKTDDKPEEIDWIERKNQLLQEEHDWNKRIADDENKSYNQRISALNDIISADQERAQIARDSEKEYEDAWNEVKDKLKPADISRIMDGSLEIEEYTEEKYGPEYVENLNKGIELWDKQLEYERKATEIEEESLAHQREALALQEEIIKNQQELVQSKMDEIESEIELANINGKYVGAGYYKDLIGHSEDMVDSYEDQIRNLQEQLTLVENDSAEHYRLLGQIEDCEAAIIDCTIQQAEWNETIERLPIERIQTYITLLQHTIEDLDNFTSNQSQLGLSPTKDQYQTYIDLYTDQINELIKKQEKLVEMQKKYDYGSEKYKEYADEIQGIDNEISGLIDKQLEYNDAILQIPINEMSEQYDNLAEVRATLDREIAENNANGLSTTIEQYADLNKITLQQLQLLVARRTALEGLLNVYDKDSDKYQETQEAINGINGEISSLVQEQYNWNQEILNMPTEKLEKINNNLSNYSSILGAVLEDYDSALAGINTLIDGQIEGIQDQLDILDKTNEARQVQLGIEQALYNLRRAEEQRSTKVIRDGEVQYESNADDLRSANQEYQDALLEKQKYDLNQQIESLEEIKNKWQEIIDKIQEAKDLQAAEDLFGAGWQDSVLADSQDLRDIFQSLYESTFAEKESVDKQIESNERLSQMMGEFVARYQEGSLTYQEALTNISGLISSMEGGFSAFEQLNGMMNLDNIASLGDIASSAESSIAGSAELLRDYLQIVGSNKASVEGFETVWSNVSSNLDETVDAFYAAADSMQEYLDAFTQNATAIDKNTSTWEEMKENIEAQVEALKAAAKALEESQKKESITVKYERDDSDDDYGGEKATGVYSSEYGYLYEYGANGNLVHPEDGRDLGVSNYKDFMEQYEEMLKDGTYHVGAEKGPVKSMNSSYTKLFKSIAIDPLKSDEIIGKLQAGEWVLTPNQVDNVVNKYRAMADMTAANTSKVPGNNVVTVNFTGGITMNEVQDVETFTNELFSNVEPILTQKLRKIF